MTTETPTLTAFLLARIAEDEADWRAVDARDVVEMLHGRPLAPRMLAECEAKRRIVERCKWVEEHPDWANDMEMAGHWEDAHATLCDLAAIWSDHPGYPLK